tara:strand:+ start:7020 stop:7232 length:213 start_codon:yes stop_codon:yes gene_type:complete
MNKQETPLDIEIKAALIKLRNTKCQCCSKKAIDDNFGEFLRGKWWCWDHVEVLYKNEGVKGTSGLMQKYY